MNKIKELKEKFDKANKINYNNLNDIFIILKKILKVLLVVIIFVGVYVVLNVCKELNIIGIFTTILSILTPFFIGIIIAWLFNPFVNFLQKKGVRRIIGTSLSYVILLAIIFFIVYSIIPLAYEQLKDLSSSIPNIVKNTEHFIDKFVNNLGGIDTSGVKDKLYGSISTIANNLTDTLPNAVIEIIKTIVSGTGTFLIGLLIGFFMLLGFNNIGDSLLIFIPKKFHRDTKVLFNKITKVLRGYVNGAMFDASIIFVACSIMFFIIGVKSPILFGLFCGLMNVIPYAGPYIGAIPCLIVAYSQSMAIGIAATISIVVIQSLEGNILSPIVMSKTTKVHPVSIIVGLLIFGHFFGIVGMLLSTPIISVLKVIVEFADSKFKFFNNTELKEEE